MSNIAMKLTKSGLYVPTSGNRLCSVNFRENEPARDNLSYPYRRLVTGTPSDIKRATETRRGIVDKLDRLEHYVRIEEGNHPPIYVVDNHHLAFYSWHEALALGDINSEVILIHLDLHADATANLSPPSGRTLTELADYTKKELSIATFIIPAIQLGLVNQFWFAQANPNALKPISSETNAILKAYADPQEIDRYTTISPDEEIEKTIAELLNSRSHPKKIILDIDIDGWVKHEYKEKLPTAADFAEAANFLASIARHVGLVTIATSPGFADQDIAVIAARRITEQIVAANR